MASQQMDWTSPFDLPGLQAVCKLPFACYPPDHIQALSGCYPASDISALSDVLLHMTHDQSPATVSQGLGEDMTKPKSRLEREKEAAAAAAAAKPGSTSEVRKSSTSNVRSKVAKAWQGQGLESVLHKRKSKLEQDKENAAAAAASTSPKESQKPGAAARSAAYDCWYPVCCCWASGQCCCLGL